MTRVTRSTDAAPLSGACPPSSAVAGGVLERLRGQFARPTGILGRLAGWIMATRGSNRERSSWSIERLDVRPEHRVLEIGFGPGVAIAELTRRAHRGQVVGIDHCEAMLRQARRRNAAAIAGRRVELLLASVDQLPPLGEPFDRVFAVNCVQFWADPVARLTDLRSLLRPGGRIAITLQPRHRGGDGPRRAAIR